MILSLEQKLMLKMNNKINIIKKTGRAKGVSYGCALLAVKEAIQAKRVVIHLPHTLRENMLFKVISLGEQYIETHTRNGITFVKGGNITFTHSIEQLYGLSRGTPLIIDEVGMFTVEVIEFCIARDFDKMYITSDEEDCGWRNPRYRKGVIALDRKGNPIYDDYSWDWMLVNWESDQTKAKDSDYKPFVSILNF